MSAIDQIFDLYLRRGSERFHRDGVTQLEHALQAAAHAAAEDASPNEVVAALLHDIGHLLQPAHDDLAGMYIDDRHEQVGASWLAQYFSPEVTEPIGLHVQAKRYICAAEHRYIEQLSPASLRSLARQGGPLSASDRSRFLANPYSACALALRRRDEQAKEPGRLVPELGTYRSRLEKALLPLAWSEQAVSRVGKVEHSP